MANQENPKAQAGLVPLARKSADTAERPGGCYINAQGIVVDAEGNVIPDLVVIDGVIHEKA